MPCSTDMAAEGLRELLRYDQETGTLYWKPRHVGMFTATKGRSAQHTCNFWNARFAHQPAFIRESGPGYLRGKINGREMMAHRVIWALVTGAWPQEQIDHINNDRADNRMCNLREASASQNQSNKRGWARSGHKGVHATNCGTKWFAAIVKHGTRHYLGRFATKDEAIAAHSEAAKRLQGEFAHGMHREAPDAL